MRLLGCLFLAGWAAAAAPSASGDHKAGAELLRKLPLRFEQDAQGRWTAHGPAFAMRFDETATSLRLADRAVRLTFVRSNSQAAFAPSAPLRTKTNYFVGKQYRAATGYSRLCRRGIYPGIDVAYYGDGERLEYDFELHPGANPGLIRMRFEGADGIRVNEKGDIVLKLGASEIVQRAPSVYQKNVAGEVAGVESRYRWLDHGEIGVALGAYDRTQPLIIDPAVMYALYLTSTNASAGVSVSVDSQGLVYLGGYTYSSDFPIGSNGYELFPTASDRNAWIWQLNPFASDPNDQLLYSTYFGGNLDTNLTSMAVDNNGLVYFGGTTIASNLPTTSGAFSTGLSNTNATNEGFVAVIDTTQAGTAGLTYCTYYAGSQITQINSVATMGGKIYATGYVNSNDLPLAGNSFQAMQSFGYDAFVAEFDPAQSGTASLVFASYLGGYSTDVGNSIAADSNGLIYVAGMTLSTDFPTTSNAYQPVFVGGGDAFLAQIDPVAGVINYCTYLGGSGADVATNVIVEAPGRVAVAGYTSSTDFPVTANAAQPANGGAAQKVSTNDAFVTELNLAAQSRATMLVYSSYYGGSDDEITYGFSRDPSGRYFLCGYTLSQNLPVTGGAINPTSVGQNIDGFLAVLDPAAGLAYGSYITSAGYQIAYGVAADSNGNAYVVGQTTSNVFGGSPPKPDSAGTFDVFFTVVSVGSSASSSLTLDRGRIQVFGPGPVAGPSSGTPRPKRRAADRR
ncbi:MAG TPA: SBBP repeat-containing protein [Bryobacteraceae bacterium]|nr:SBBP repeat-containing protein [Bryobacteraceae bacterium]